MKKVLLSLFVAAAVLTSCKDKTAEAGNAEEVKTASAEATPYTVDTAGSTIEWKATKPGGSHNGTVGLSSGTVSVKDGKVESGSFNIDLTSITVLDLKAGDGKEDLEAHLKGDTAKNEADADHFFNTKKHPTGKFEVTSVATGADGKTNVEGNLTLKGITKNVKFPANVTVSDTEVTIASEPFSINRTDWKVNYGSKSVFQDLGDKFIDDNIEVKVNVKAKK